MREPEFIFQNISVRRRIIISIGLLTVLIIVVGLYGLVAVAESNKRLHKSVVEGQKMADAIDAARLSQVHFKKQVQEWKNILLRGNDNVLFDTHLKAFNEEEKKVNDHLKSLSSSAEKLGLSADQIAGMISDHEKLGHQYREALKKYRHHDLKSAVLIDQSVRGIDRDLTDKIDNLVISIKAHAGKRLQEIETSAKTQMEAYHTLSFIIIFLILVGVGVGIFNARSITRDLPGENHGGQNSDDE